MPDRVTSARGRLAVLSRRDVNDPEGLAAARQEFLTAKAVAYLVHVSPQLNPSQRQELIRAITDPQATPVALENQKENHA